MTGTEATAVAMSPAFGDAMKLGGFKEEVSRVKIVKLYGADDCEAQSVAEEFRGEAASH